MYQVKLEDLEQGRLYVIAWREKNNKRHQARQRYHRRHVEVIFVLNKDQVLTLGHHYITSLTTMQELRDKIDLKQHDKLWVNAIYSLS